MLAADPDLMLLREQFAREQGAQDAAREALAAECPAAAGGSALTHAERDDLILRGFERLRSAVEAELAQRTGRPSVLRQQVGDLPTDIIAYTALRVLVTEAPKEPSQQTVAVRIGDTLAAECALRRAREEHSDLWRRCQRLFGGAAAAGRDRKHARLNALLAEMRRRSRYDETCDDAGFEARLRVGLQLIQLALANTELFVLKYRANKPNLLGLGLEAQASLHVLNARISASARAVHLPLVVPPRPWKDFTDGGYFSQTLRLMKAPAWNPFVRRYMDRLQPRRLPELFGAVNALQETAWRINERVLSAMEALAPRLADADAEPAEQTPENLDVPAADDARRRDDWSHNKIIGEIYRRDARLSDVISLARENMSRPFYYAWQIDFRGRAYPIGTFLHPQGHDSALALLSFAVERPVGGGEEWLALHGANMLGFEGGTVVERIGWIHAHEAEIRETARRPLDTLDFWLFERDGSGQVRDKAWRALAFCLEWAAFKEQGGKFRSGLPVAVDGTCNAFQHLAALLRDDAAAGLVNLVDAGCKADLYREIAAEVRIRFASEAPPELRAKLSGPDASLERIIDRDCCKRPVMTMPYGISTFGMCQQILAALEKKRAGSGPAPALRNLSRTELHQLATYIGGTVRAAIERRLGKVVELMNWLRAAGRMLAEQGAPVRWSTPTGFAVQQAYLRNRRKVIKSEMSRLEAFSSFQLTIKLPTDELCPKKAASGIVANFVHSFDAAHMMRTTLAATAQISTPLRMIHDSFATLPSDAARLSQLLRQEFLRMYEEQDWLGAFELQCRRTLGHGEQALPPQPARGRLELSSVLTSPYFFS